MAKVKNNKHYLFAAIFLFCWLPILFVSTVVVGLVYVTVHQVYRQSANDPQTQLAEDSRYALDNNLQLPYVSDLQQVDLNTSSLSPFRIIYDQNGHVVESQAKLDGANPQLPPSVLTNAKKNGDLTFTWEPASGARFAAVVVPRNQGQKNYGYVLVARSLRLVEQREDLLLKECALAYLTLVVGSFVLVFLLAKVLSKKQ